MTRFHDAMLLCFLLSRNSLCKRQIGALDVTSLYVVANYAFITIVSCHPFIKNNKKKLLFLVILTELSLLSFLPLGEKEYYEKQFATLRSFEEVDAIQSHQDINEEQDRQEQALHERAMNISNGANVFLLVFKVILEFLKIMNIVFFGTPFCHFTCSDNKD